MAIDAGKISQVGGAVGPGRREIDAAGKLVTPGWVDIHTHYDAQATWDPYLTPSTWHGVTTVVMGNCGVGFAPAKPDEHDWLIRLMEGVEDIPGAALTEGIQWGWETFPEYMDSVAKMRRAIDVAVQVPHGAVRAYVMGERGAKNEHANSDDIAAMSRIVREGIEAGALGFSTSRTLIHRSTDGNWVPGTFAEEDELEGLAKAVRAGGNAVFQMTSNHADMPKEMDWMARLSRKLDQKFSFNCVQIDEHPDLWKRMLDRVDRAAQEGARVYPQVAGRPAGIIMGFECTANPFVSIPAWHEVAHLPLAEKMAALKQADIREKITTGDAFDLGELANFITTSFHKMFALDSKRPSYEPDPEHSVASIAARTGGDPKKIAYDFLSENEGRGFMYFPIFNYTHGHMDPIREMLLHPLARIGLGDGGAHAGTICDASIPTFMLTHWTRDRTRGPKLELEHVVKRQTMDTASLFGLNDRGVLEAGKLADINVIDYDNLELLAPEMVYDLPASGRRLVQQARGYDATIKSGELIFSRGVASGALPGELIRGAR